jgi:Calcineurin-like phosphoesterase
MFSRVPSASLAFVACLLAADGIGIARLESQAGNNPRIVAVGDIHGSGDGLTQILRAAGLIDEKQRWSGRNARLVQTGDFTDRGDDVRQVMDLLMRLEGEARRAGGRVDVLFGNHEGMNILRDLRDVSARAYATFADQRSEDRRRRAFEAHAEIAKRKGMTIAREEWMAAHPLGFVEYVQALSASGQYGRWLRTRKPILQIDETIFMHAGLHPERVTTIDEVNRTVEREIRGWDQLVDILEQNKLAAPASTLQEIIDVAQVEIGNIVVAQKTQEPLPEHVTREYVVLLQSLQNINTWALIDSNGPLWYRGLASETEVAPPALDALLTRLGAKRFVTGHTPQPGRIATRFGGRVILIDTGMLTSFFKSGQPSALEIQGDKLTAIYPANREPVATSQKP